MTHSPPSHTLPTSVCAALGGLLRALARSHPLDGLCFLLLVLGGTSAAQAQELSRASQLHAEAAARDLLAAKKAEMQVLPLMTGGKNPDPAAAELLKAQAAAKCAEQLKVRTYHIRASIGPATAVGVGVA